MTSLNVLLLTEQADSESVLPPLSLVVPGVRPVSLNGPTRRDCADADVAVVDAQSDMCAARQACLRIAATAPATAVVVVASAENFVAVDLDWNVDEVMFPTACTAELHTRLRLAVDRRHKAVEDTFQFGDLVLHPASYTGSLPPDDQLD